MRTTVFQQEKSEITFLHAKKGKSHKITKYPTKWKIKRWKILFSLHFPFLLDFSEYFWNILPAFVWRDFAFIFSKFFGIFRRFLDGRIYLCWVIWWKIVILFDYGLRINRDFGGEKEFSWQETFKSDWKSMEGNLCGQVKSIWILKEGEYFFERTSFCIEF